MNQQRGLLPGFFGLHVSGGQQARGVILGRLVVVVMAGLLNPDQSGGSKGRVWSLQELPGTPSPHCKQTDTHLRQPWPEKDLTAKGSEGVH